jgi:uncharacterized protein
VIRSFCTLALLASLAACSAERPAGDPGTSDTGSDTPDDVGSDEGAPPDVEVTIATWNVRFFYDDVCDLGTCGEDTRELIPSTEEFQTRAAQVAEAIERIDADIILLQEVETQACLDAVAENLSEDYQLVMGEIRRAGSLDTAVLVRTAQAPRFVKHRQDSFVREDGETRQFLREFMEVHTTIGDVDVIVLNGHFRSRRRPDDPEQRHAEASRAREIALQVSSANPDALIVLGGDLNDVPGSPTLDILEEGGAMYRTGEELGMDGWTVNSFGNLSAIDHLMLLDGRGTFVPGTARILRDVNSLGGSDHAAMIAGFAR